jgi:hypothetical protein
MKRFCAAIFLCAFGLIAGVMVERLLLHAPVITGGAVASKAQPSQADAAISRIPQESALSHSPELSLAELEPDAFRGGGADGNGFGGGFAPGRIHGHGRALKRLVKALLGIVTVRCKGGAE